MSTIFHWKEDDIDSLLRSCDTDEVLPFVLKYLPTGGRVLESGCGLGRFVKYLQDRGWDMIGLEYSKPSLDLVHKTWPQLKVIQGDVGLSPFREETFDGVISLGVVEHFVDGPDKPLKDIYRILKKNSIAIITVPCMNSVRMFKELIWWNDLRDAFLYILRSIIKGRPSYQFEFNRLRNGYKYIVAPSIGPFYEYHMSVERFAAEVRRVGFEIVEHQPLDHIDGLYHELNPFKLLVKFNNWEFNISRFAYRLNKILMAIPFFHCHMQVVIARKSCTKD